MHDLLLGLLYFGIRQVDFVHYRDDFESLLDGQVEIGERLGLHAFRGIYQEDRAFDGRQGTRHFVVEIHMARGIDQVQQVLLALVRIVHLDRLELDRDAAFPLEIHLIEELLFHLALLDRFGQL